MKKVLMLVLMVWLISGCANLSKYEEAVRLNPNSSHAHFELGVAYAKAGEGPGAIIHMTMAEKIYEKENDLGNVAIARANLRLMYAKFFFLRPEDFAYIKAP